MKVTVETVTDSGDSDSGDSGVLAFKADRLWYHSILGLIVIKKEHARPPNLEPLGFRLRVLASRVGAPQQHATTSP